MHAMTSNDMSQIAMDRSLDYVPGKYEQKRDLAEPQPRLTRWRTRSRGLKPPEVDVRIGHTNGHGKDQKLDSIHCDMKRDAAVF